MRLLSESSSDDIGKPEVENERFMFEQLGRWRIKWWGGRGRGERKRGITWNEDMASSL